MFPCFSDGESLLTINAPVLNENYHYIYYDENYTYFFDQKYDTFGLTFAYLYSYHKITMTLHSFGLLFNILTLIVISRFKAKSRSYKLMAVLAVADIGSCLGTFLNFLRNILIASKSQTRLTMCLIYTIYYESMISFGTYVYLMLTIDRFVALVKAIEYRTIMTKNKYIIYTAFLLTHHILVYFVSYTFFPNDEKTVGMVKFGLICNSVYLIHANVRYYMFGFITLLALITTGLCITLVIYLIVKQFKRRSLHQGGSGSNNLTKATTTLIIVSTVYAILYTQLVVIQVLTIGKRIDDIVRVRDASDYAFMVNHIINPIIYFIRMPELRKEFHGLLLCCSRK